MGKKIEYYLHLYLGCEVQTPDGIGKLHSVAREPIGEPSERVHVFFGKMVKTKNSVDGGYDKVRNHGDYMVAEKSYVGMKAPENSMPEFTIPGGVSLLLRPLSDMTEEERSEYLKINTPQDWTEQCEANNTLWLLSRHFDLFGLIESGLAIDKTKQQ